MSDIYTVPRCAIHHRALHDDGAEEIWWVEHGIDAKGEAVRLWNQSHSSGPDTAGVAPVPAADGTAGAKLHRGHAAQAPGIRKHMGTELEIIDSRRVAQLRPRAGRRKRAPGTDVPKPGPDGIFLFDEDPEAYRRFPRDLVGALSPRDALEDLLVDRIVTCGWRLRRVCRIEGGIFNTARASWQNGVTRIAHDVALVFLRLASNDDDLSKLTRYERSLERSLLRAVQELHRCQSRRGRQLG